MLRGLPQSTDYPEKHLILGGMSKKAQQYGYGAATRRLTMLQLRDLVVGLEDLHRKGVATVKGRSGSFLCRSDIISLICLTLFSWSSLFFLVGQSVTVHNQIQLGKAFGVSSPRVSQLKPQSDKAREQILQQAEKFAKVPKFKKRVRVPPRSVSSSSPSLFCCCLVMR